MGALLAARGHYHMPVLLGKLFGDFITQAGVGTGDHKRLAGLVTDILGAPVLKQVAHTFKRRRHGLLNR